jgi:hypothetical protein
MVSQPPLSRLRSSRRRPRRHPLSERAPLSLQALWTHLRRDKRHCPLADAQTTVADNRGGYPAGLRLSSTGYRGGLRPRRAYCVARWQRESGVQCRRVHQHLIEAGRVALLQVQADEIRVKAVGAVYWLASAMEVRSRLWLGGMISRHRDKELIRGLVLRVRCSAVLWRRSCW